MGAQVSAVFVDPSKGSFLGLQIFTFCFAMFTMILTFNKPWYIAKRNDNHNECTTLSKDACNQVLVKYLSPFEYTIKGTGGTDCVYSCPFPENLTEFRGAMCCVTIVVIGVISAVRLGPHSPSTFMSWNALFGILSILWFSLFILDTNATDIGYGFCDDGFKIKDDVNDATYQYMTSSKIKDCSSSKFAGICCLDLIMVLLMVSSIYMIRKYRLFLDGAAPAI